MNENILVIGARNNIIDQFSGVTENQENKIFFVKEGAENGWNKASPISARSNLLQVKNLFGEIHKVFIFYDSNEYIRYNNFDVETISKSVDSMILGYSYLTSEVLKFFKEQGFGEIVFILLDSEDREKSILEEIGISAFSSMAESIAQKKAGKQFGVTLIKGNSEIFENSMDWLYSYIENPNSKKAALLPKHASKWVKIGSKTPVILPFIK